MSGSRHFIPVAPAPLPDGAATAPFRIAEGDNHVKYGHPVFEGTAQRGDPHWTAEIITQTWYQAETGRIPISGAGYGGPFAGEGFDELWLDMSEIVRPTRDGIHGREVISTEVDLGAGLTSLAFDGQGRLLTRLPSWITLPIPVIFDTLPLDLPTCGGLEAALRAARRLDTLALVDPTALDTPDEHAARWLAPRLRPGSFDALGHAWKPRLIEIEADSPQVAESLSRWPEAPIVPRLLLSPVSPQSVLDLTRAGIRAVHLVADEMARDTAGRTLLDAVHQVHTRLVDEALRDRVTLIVSGGIAAAEHVAKAIACGADLVAIDHVILAAWGCGLWADRGPCRAEREGVDPEWGRSGCLT
ncbi:MAG: glutamate synthase-related protein [Chloroflexota bacterium]